LNCFHRLRFLMSATDKTRASDMQISSKLEVRTRTESTKKIFTITSSYPTTNLNRPLGIQEVQTPRISRQTFYESGKVSPTHQTSSPPIPSTHLFWRFSQPQDHSAAGRIVSIKNSNDYVGSRTLYLPPFSSVPQQTAPPRDAFSLRLKFIALVSLIFYRLQKFVRCTAISKIPFIPYHPKTSSTCLETFWSMRMTSFIAST
jgi:hypothetical protein